MGGGAVFRPRYCTTLPENCTLLAVERWMTISFRRYRTGEGSVECRLVIGHRENVVCFLDSVVDMYFYRYDY